MMKKGEKKFHYSVSMQRSALKTGILTSRNDVFIRKKSDFVRRETDRQNQRKSQLISEQANNRNEEVGQRDI